MAIQESGEMYLKTILLLSRVKNSVRAKDISDFRNFSKPSVSRAVGILKKDGLITVSENGSITLTQQGRIMAEKTLSKHDLLYEYLLSIGVSEETAEDDACKMEHIISDESYQAIKELLENKS